MAWIWYAALAFVSLQPMIPLSGSLETKIAVSAPSRVSHSDGIVAWIWGALAVCLAFVCLYGVRKLSGVLLMKLSPSAPPRSSQLEGNMSWIMNALNSFQHYFGSLVPLQATSLDHLRLPTQLNDYVYEVCKPQGRPSVEVVFFHGLQLDRGKEAHLTTWLSSSLQNEELWPRWIAERFSEARILLVAYDGFFRKTDDQGRTDMHITGENLVQSLTEEAVQVGRDGCPVVLVGHCIGGLVIKELLLQANTMLSLDHPDKCNDDVQCLLESVKELFYYATPHHGSKFADIGADFSKGLLVEHITVLNKEAARCNEAFRRLRQKYGWKAHGIAESLPVTLGKFETNLLVPDEISESHLFVQEASTRSDVNNLYTVSAHHFDVCRPTSKTDSCYTQLINVIDRALKEDVHGHEMSFSNEVVGLDDQFKNVTEALKRARRLGIVGTGGMGKSTLAKVVYNSISGDFEYTCFLDNVKDSIKKSDTMEVLQRKILESLYYKGRRKAVSWSRLTGKRVLLILDDVEHENQIYAKLHLFSEESRVLVTSREQRFLIRTGFKVHEAKHLDDEASRRLFCLHAFKGVNPPVDYITRVELFMKKCRGLPLALEVTGKYLSTQNFGDVSDDTFAMWDDTFKKLSQAKPLDGRKDDELWSVFQVIYDRLAEDEQQMFLDIATCFQGEELESVKRAWRACSWAHPDAGWRNLLDKGLVNGVWTENGYMIQMHEVLRDLGCSIACLNCTIPQKSTRICHEVIDRLPTWPFTQEKPNFEVRVLKIVCNGGPHYPRPKIDIETLQRLERLEIVWLDGVSLCGSRNSFPVNLAFLKVRRCCWREEDDFESPSNGIAVEGSSSRREASFQTSEKHPRLRLLEIEGLGVLKYLPDTLGLDSLRISCGRRSAARTRNLRSIGMLSLTEAFILGKLPSLSCLDISSDDLGDRGAKSLALAIRSGQMKNLAELELSSNSIGDEGLIELADSFQAGLTSMLPNLSSLKLENISLTEVGMLSLAEAFTSGKLASLSCVDISSNNIGDEGAKSLALAVRSGELKNVSQLQLNRIGITDAGLTTLADSFQEGVTSPLPNLSSLELRNESYGGAANSFTEVGLVSLVEALKSGHLNSLEVLDVEGDWNPSERVAIAFVSALSSNNLLTVDVKYEWSKFSELDRWRKRLIERNSRNRDILDGLVTVPMVQSTLGKVYICGDPMVGKTTLRHTLQRTYLSALLSWETRPHMEPRTRGVDVSLLSTKCNKPDEKPISLLLWDMAGQEDFHLVHNAFFPDLGFAEGKASTFIVVCSSENTLQESKDQLEYWLQYIASGCGKTMQNPRHVFVVMNNMHGRRKIHGSAWKLVLEHEKNKFEHYLKIRTDFILMDVRIRKQVDGLKSCLLEHCRNLLRYQEVPSICQAIQENLSQLSQRCEHFSVLHWTEFVEQVGGFLQEPWPEHIIEAATRYLNEAGVVIYIDRGGDRLVIVDPNWFFRKILGKVFLTRDMASSTEELFRTLVDQTTGTISISNMKKFFQSSEGEWDEAQADDMIAILVWLGLCYKGKDENIFLPALIAKKGTPGDPWCLRTTVLHGGDQWVMGFSVRHQNNEVALAPMSLWHRFQVDLAQTLKFNGQTRRDNGFVADKYFVTFVVDYMNVLIEVDANLDKPTFQEISIQVKPRFERAELVATENEMAATEMKQRQVDLADDLVERLLKLWNQICPGAEYEQRVIWPWPASCPRPEDKPERNVKVAEVQKWVQERGVGTKMEWVVGIGDPITDDQLLSTKNKWDVVKSVERDLSIVRQGMKEAVDLGIFPGDVLTDEVFPDKSFVALDGIDISTSTTHEEQDEMYKLSKLLMKILKPNHGTLSNVENLVREVRDGFGEVLKKQKQLLHKLQDTEKMFLEDMQSICPKFIYLGTRDSAYASLKEALSISETVRLHFACEAGYGNYRPHGDVENQQGLDVSQFEDWARTVLPWLKVSLTVLFISAKVAENLVAPGVGLISPNFVDWQQTMTLSDGLALATGFSQDQLEHMIQGTGLDVNDAHGDPLGLYRKSRKAVSGLLGKLKSKEFEEKIGLRKVALKYHDGTLHGIVWICSRCFKKFPSEMVTEM